MTKAVTVTIFLIHGHCQVFTFGGSTRNETRTGLLESISKQIKNGSVTIDNSIIPANNIAWVDVT